MKLSKRIIRVIVALILFVPLFILNLLYDFKTYVILPLSLVPYLLVGYDVLWKSIKNIKRGQILDENFLMIIATIGALIIGEYLEAVAVMIFYQIGEEFQEFAINKSRKSIAGLMDIKAEYATKINDDGSYETIEPEDCIVGDKLIIKAGEKVPVDGIIVEGSSSLDVKSLTGEAIPREVNIGDIVLSGSININGVIIIEVTNEYFDSTVSKILDMVENAYGKKARSENFITKFAKYYTPIVVLLALLLAFIPPIFIGNLSDWVFRALTFLVVSCPCALVISVPLGFFCGIGGASKYGILIKGGSYLEMLNKTNIFVFDKTGTITTGEFKIVNVNPINISSEELLKIVSSIEQNSNHPIAKGILNSYKGELINGFSVNEIGGFGLKASYENDEYLVGSKSLMEKNNIEFVINESIGSVVYISKNNKFIGSIVVSDIIKDKSILLFEYLKSKKYTSIILTGDNRVIAEDIAEKVNADKIYSELLPHQKVEILEEIIKNKNEKDVVSFIGDGINDAPAIMRSDVGISMGGIGSDSAIEASDIVLMYDDLSSIIKAKKIARKTINIIRQNIIFALTIKIGVLILSAFGLSNMWMAILADVGVAVLAILNSMRAMKIKE